MPGLKLQAEERAGLAKLLKLGDQKADALLEAIRSASVKIDVDGLAIANLPEIPDLPKSDEEAILESLDSLYHIRAYAEVELDDFISDISDCMESTLEKEFPEPSNASQRLRDRLKQFLGIQDVNRAAKSSILRYEQERTVHSVRILTDARPVFGDDASQPPEAAVIFHTLKVAYHHAGRLGETFLSFDERDLEELKKAVLRAESKAASLLAVLGHAQVKVFKLK